MESGHRAISWSMDDWRSKQPKINHSTIVNSNAPIFGFPPVAARRPDAPG
jgi:hypothetical protein